MQGRARVFAALAIIGAATLALVYVAFVLTKAGQHVDDGAYMAREMERSSVAAAFRRLLNVIEPATILAMVVVIAVIGFLRRIIAIAVWSIVGMLFAIASAEVLKWILPRPVLDTQWDEIIGKTDSYPSGHATIATTFVLALLIVTAPQLRALVQVFGTLLVSGVGLGVIIAGWHRPSDVLGALGLSLAVMGGTAALLTWTRGHSIDPVASSYRGPWEVAALTGLLMVVFVLSLRHSLHDRTVHYLLLFGAVILVCIGVMLASFAWAMRRVDWGDVSRRGD